MFTQDLLNELTFTPLNAADGVAITANGVGAAVSLTGMIGEAAVILDIPAGTGTLPTLSVAVTTCATSNGTFVPLNNAAGTPIVFTTATSTKVQQVLSIDTRIASSYVQLAWTIGGTGSPSFPSLVAWLVSSAQVH